MSEGKRTLYYMAESAPCRTVLAVLRMLNLEVELKSLNLFAKEQLSEDFIKINQFHVVPTLVEPDGFTLWESRAIVTYLVQKYQPESPLYPAGDLKTRANIDKFLYYDIGTYYKAMSVVLYPVFGGGKLGLDQLPQYQDVLKMLNGYLDGKSFLVGDQMTLADLSLYFSLTMGELLPELNFTSYENVASLFAKVDALVKPYDHDGLFAGARANFKSFIDNKLAGK